MLDFHYRGDVYKQVKQFFTDLISFLIYVFKKNPYSKLKIENQNLKKNISFLLGGLQICKKQLEYNSERLSKLGKDNAGLRELCNEQMNKMKPSEQELFILRMMRY